MKQLKDGARELFVVDDKLGTPTYTVDFARNVDLLLGTGLGASTTWSARA